MEGSIINFFARRGALVLVDQATGKVAVVPATRFAFCPEDLVNAIEADRKWSERQEQNKQAWAKMQEQVQNIEI